MKRVALLLALLVVISLAPAFDTPRVAAQRASKPPRITSPPGQLQVATVNARQNKILGTKRLEALIALVKAFRFRPAGFNGGSQGAVIAPDVLVISEFRPTNVEVLVHRLGVKFDIPYEIVGPNDVQAALVINTETVALQGQVELVNDVCADDTMSEKPRFFRQYPVARFTEVSTGAPFSVAGVHLARDYSHTGEQDCVTRNVDALRSELENDPGAVFMAGDFNFRSTETPYECDSNEETAPMRWWSMLVAPEQGRAYVDAVREHHRSRGGSMVDEWTYQHPRASVTCNNTTAVRRSRIDYIFVSDAVVAEAHADHPGWAADGVYKYSDHRYVLGRFVLTGPPRPNRVTAVPDAGGVIHLTWEAVDGATGWIVYRARAGDEYAEQTRLDASVLAFDDTLTDHGVRYRYSIAPLASNGAQGLEAPATWVTADARGPRVTSVRPAAGATGVDRDVRVRVTFDEWVDAASVGADTIRLYRNGNRVAGRVIRKGGFVLLFDPAFRLAKGETYTVLVTSVADVLGNEGPTFRSRFTTFKPRKRDRR